MEIKVWGWGGWVDVLGSALGHRGHGVKLCSRVSVKLVILL